ncbi:hypothetical protein GCM10010112_89900 [Actinoplanes lobatus]|uniref:DUF4243 domain-containing protein n=1 Tax=Actinoplanes lobatus TaxID=113568 RepID=A0A7W7MIB6_9ACTN|nr:questin oxidase family protein [Actinoplanes lobatus]MBB4751248.1 hypothetical protein [Actinoplanes lobatus]GGN97525.1 hypothetical protein GCM10010112_89900 [Actinoplanes lobatus]GIE44220.1 hypothetical protein Alo02nite_71180 [Actinoplanes lobatus]
MANATLDEVYERLCDTGPEFDGWLSNHAPMAAEALIHHGHADRVHRWLDDYRRNLEPRPRGISPIGADEWPAALGDPTRTGDWLNFFEREMTTDPWPDVLARWWPRLLPGIAAGATHGVIRVGHAVRALLTPPGSALPAAGRIAELGQALAYWAARWQPMALPGSGPYRTTDPRSALDTVPRVPDQRFGIRSRLAQLAGLPAWPGVPAGPSPAPVGSPTVPFLNGRDPVPAGPPTVGEIPSAARLLAADNNTVHDRILAIIEAAVVRQAGYGYANPVMLVHAATAPTAVLRTLPALPGALHLPSLAAAWAATAAVTSAYAPEQPRPVTPRPGTGPEDLMAYAADNGDAHAIKLADAAIEAGDAEALACAYRALERFAP